MDGRTASKVRNQVMLWTIAARMELNWLVVVTAVATSTAHAGPRDAQTDERDASRRPWRVRLVGGTMAAERSL